MANVLNDLFVKDFVNEDFKKDLFSIEINRNSITVDRKHQRTSLIESKTITVDKDVLVYVNERDENLYELECRWLWRDSTIFENLSRAEALELKRIIFQLADSNRNISIKKTQLKGIQVGNQIWSDKNIEIELGLDSRNPMYQENTHSNTRQLYTYSGAERLAVLYPKWRIPTVDDYKELLAFFKDNTWRELTGNMKFKMDGFFSETISEKELDQFLDMNPALRPKNAGFYWTSDIEDYDPRDIKSGNRKYIYFNTYTRDISIEHSINANNNFFSLRLIHR